MLRMTWSKSGDALDINSVSDEFSEFFVDIFNDPDNSWSLSNISSDIRPVDTVAISEELYFNISQVNKCCKKCNLLVKLTEAFDHTNQSHLNQLHSEWVSAIRRHPKLDFLLDKIDPLMGKRFHDINTMVHLLEKGFTYSIRTPRFCQHENIFKDLAQPWGEFHISLVYADFGRCAFEKFLTNSSTVTDAELVNWNTIVSHVRIQLSRPYVSTPPAEYVDLCKYHGLVPHGQCWPLGNLCNWQYTLTEARKIMERNVRLSGNHAVFEIKK